MKKNMLITVMAICLLVSSLSNFALKKDYQAVNKERLETKQKYSALVWDTNEKEIKDLFRDKSYTELPVVYLDFNIQQSESLLFSESETLTISANYADSLKVADIKGLTGVKVDLEKISDREIQIHLNALEPGSVANLELEIFFIASVGGKEFQTSQYAWAKIV